MTAAKKKIKEGRQFITPAIARDWMDNHNYEDNRPISKSRVRHYARQMTAGRWQYNGETIIFDVADKLLNGQHRLLACIESGKRIEVMVVTGVATSAFTTMDQNYVRSAAQVLGMQGHANNSCRAAVCRAMWRWETCGGKVPSSSSRVSPDEVLLAQEVYGDEIDAAVLWAASVGRQVPISSGLLGLAHILLRRARPRKSTEFLQVLADGLTTSKHHPARILRERVINDKMRDRQLPPVAQWCALVRAWNHFDKGDDIKNLGIKRNPDGDWVQNHIRGLPRHAKNRKIK